MKNNSDLGYIIVGLIGMVITIIGVIGLYYCWWLGLIGLLLGLISLASDHDKNVGLIGITFACIELLTALIALG